MLSLKALAAAWVSGLIIYGSVHSALAQTAVPAPAPDITEAPTRSAMDALMFFLVLAAEIEFSSGQPGRGFELLLDAARRGKQDELFRRAVQMAAQAKAADQAMQAVRLWRETLPASRESMQFALQVAVATGRFSDAPSPFVALVNAAPATDRPALIRNLGDLLEPNKQVDQAAVAFEPALQTLARQPGLNAVALTTLARLWALADQRPKAYALIDVAAQANPNANDPVLLAIDLMQDHPPLQAWVQQRVARADADPVVLLRQGQWLMQAQRQGDALPLLQRVVHQRPTLAVGWLMLGTAHVDLRNHRAGEEALARHLALADTAAEGSDDASREQSRSQALYGLALAAEQKGHYAAALQWLDKLPADAQIADVVFRRASIMARQGRLDEARAMVRAVPSQEEGEARRKLMIEAGLLRDAKRWQGAYDLLAQAARQHTNDATVLYEQATAAEKLGRLDEMEQLLRQAMALQPKSHHAFNALGYALADRNQRLPEARVLINQALSLAPGDPFVADSLGWLEFRAGNREEALRVLRGAWVSRPDPEIGAHLGEVLWTEGQRDEARTVWRESRERDGGNDTLQETLRRLKIEL
jgi:tetratricopeptide (TPR) repeat protein